MLQSATGFYASSGCEKVENDLVTTVWVCFTSATALNADVLSKWRNQL